MYLENIICVKEKNVLHQKIMKIKIEKNIFSQIKNKYLNMSDLLNSNNINQDTRIISNIKLFIIVFCFLIYGNLDNSFNQAQNIGNLAYAGVFLGLIKHRNIIYILFTILCITYYLNINNFLQLFILVLLLFTFYKFINLINKYKQFLIF
jgi:hypothetical protein